MSLQEADVCGFWGTQVPCDPNWRELKTSGETMAIFPRVMPLSYFCELSVSSLNWPLIHSSRTFNFAQHDDG